MKNYILFLSVLFFTACSQTRMIYYPYVGNKTIEGDGGFLETVVFSEDIPKRFFDKEAEYKYDSVAFFKQGLPEKVKCSLVGYMSYGRTLIPSYEQYKEMAKELLVRNVNVATQSALSLPIVFDKNSGSLNVGAAGENSQIYNVYGDSIGNSFGYVLFECE